MKKLWLLITILFCLFIFFNQKVSAVTHPLSVSNNHFGIHIINQSDLVPAADLLNSQGGQWGYVTFVIPASDRNLEKWQSVFDQCRQLKLIPIVRLATRLQNDYWVKPELEDLDNWVDFLTSLNWVVKNRYLILYNEPNHAKEWGNQINPQEYTLLISRFIEKLKKASPDFFILPAALDLAAPDSPQTMDAQNFFNQMQAVNPQIFTLFDGWNSHSYPNPGFQSSPFKTGRTSIQGFLWEIDYLSRFNLNPQIPVFITETGWDQSRLSEAQLADYYKTAYQNIWLDPRIVAITPFVLNYTHYPFSHFSWQKADNQTFNSQFEAVKQLPKTKGQPIQINQSRLSYTKTSLQYTADNHYTLLFSFQNTGQSIWQPEDFSIKISTDLTDYSLDSPWQPILPGEQITFSFQFMAPSQNNLKNISAQLAFKDQNFGQLFTHQLPIKKDSNIFRQITFWLSYPLKVLFS